MSLRRKLLVLSGVIFVGLVSLLHVISQRMLLASFAALERENAQKNVERVLVALSYELSELDRITVDWAEWDDTYAFMEDRNPEYIESNLGDVTLVDLKLNVMLFVDASGQVVFSKGMDWQSGREIPVPASLQELFAADGPFFQRFNLSESITGVLRLPESFMLMAARPILTSLGQGPSRGLLIFGRYLNEAEVARLAEVTQLPLAVMRLDDPQVPPELLAGDREGQPGQKEQSLFLIRAENAETVAGYALVQDIYGQPALVLRMTMPRDLFRHGLITVRAFAFSITGVGLIFGALVLLFIDTAVVSRLVRLYHEVSRIGASKNFSARVSVAGSDELSDLARAINEMVAALEESQRALQKSEAQFRAIFERAAIGIGLTDEKGRTLRANPALHQILGYRAEELRGMSFAEVTYPDDLEPDLSLYRELMAGQRDHYQLEKRYLRKDGQLIWGRVILSLARDTAGKPWFAVGMVEDITQHKRAEEELHRRGAILEAINFAAERFLRFGDWEKCIQEVLERLGQAVDVSRAYVFENHAGSDGVLLTSQRHEWVAPGITPQIDNPELQNFSWEARGFGRWVELMSQGQAIYGPIREFPDAERVTFAAQDIQSLVCVPILTDTQRWWGFIGFDECRYEREWSEVEIELLKTAAGILGAAIQRQRAEEAEREQRQLAEALREISNTLTSTLDLNEVLDRTLEKVGHVVPHDAADIMLIESGVARVVRHRGYTQRGLQPWITALRFTVSEVSNLRQMAETGQPMLIEDVWDYEGWVIVEEALWIRSYIGAPIRLKDRVIGFLNLNSSTPGFFSAAHAERLQAFADQVAIALENAHLYDEARRRLQEVTLLSRVISLTASATNLREAWQEICAELARFFRVPQATFALLNPERTSAEVIAEYRDPDRPSGLGIRIPVADNPSMAYILAHKAPLAITDAQSDPRLAPISEVMRHRGTTSILIVPILSDGEVIGTLGIDAVERREFSEAEILLAQHVASQIGQALGRLQLFTAVQEHADRMDRLVSLTEALNRSMQVEELFAVIGQGALALSGADRVAVTRRNPDDTFTFVWSRGISQTYSEAVTSWLHELPGARLLKSPDPILITDIETQPKDTALYRLAVAEGYRALAIWPLVYEGRTTAAVGCYYDQPHLWSEDEQEVMLTFARQAAVALENARLYATLREANEQLQEALRAKDEMIQNVSHELRTPLTLIMGYVELLREGALGSLSPEQEHAVAVLASQSARLKLMVEQLLTLQTFRRDALCKERFDLGPWLTQHVRAWAARAAAAGVELMLDLSPDLPPILADSSLLSHVINNLLDNAIKFSPDGGRITVRARVVADGEPSSSHALPSLIISVTDEGIGIPPDKLNRVFERFYQVNGGLARRFGGMGIGLALCQRIVEAHDGRIWAESEGEGRGSTFYIMLPLTGA
ncbi:MAG: GAF domain-containing protein [Anaerolineae bacterium]|nr:GAF domain-containing protein [Anaerolineae bacterium]MDW8098981.1 GAF domain-containing protein [Anaerolineae bacterium]